jgi:hypothetical protein
MIRFSVVVGVLVGVLALTTSCSYLLDRLDDVPPGAVNGRTVDAEASVVAFSRIGLESTTRVARALDDGNFQIEGLTRGAWMLRFIDDKDGDGAPEQSALRAIRISDAVDASGDEVLTSVLLGDVTLDGTAVVAGRVVDQEGAPVGGIRVVVYRNTAELDADQAAALGEGEFDVDLGAEQQTTTDDEGRFRLEGVGRGTVRIAAVSLDGLLASAPLIEAVLPGDALTTEDIVLVPGATRTVQVSIQNPPSDGTVTVDVVAHGAAKGSTPLATSTVEAGAVVGGLEVPTTIVDAYVFDIAPSGQVRREGFVLGRVVPAGSGNPNEVLDIVLWGDVELVAGDACAAPANRANDRDGDGANALPDPAIDEAAWSACVTSCASSFGTDGAPARCGELDCDDDEDGQPDVTEPYACVSMCGGTDLDGDGACAADAFPQCAADDASDETCAGVDQGAFQPPPSLYEPSTGDGPDVPLDLGPLSAWQLGVPANTGGDCTEQLGRPNPREADFSEVGGDGVSFEAVSDTAECCSCIERVRTLAVPQGLFDVDAIVGTLRTSFSGEASQALLQVELFFSGTPIVSQLVKTEERPQNNCLGTQNALVVSNGGRFEVSLFSGVPVDEVRVHLQGYACGDADASIALEGFGLNRVDGGEGEGEGEGEGDPCFAQPPPTCDAAGTQQVFCQAHLDALAGCTSGGNVSIFGEDITTLAPLSSMTSAQLLAIGTTSLTSLAGLEALDTVSSIQLQGNALLVDVSAMSGTLADSIIVSSNPLLPNLNGFDVLSNTTNISLNDNASLTDLSALAVPALGALNITASPTLTSLESLSGLASLQQLFITNYAGTDLAGLEDLTFLGTLFMQDAPSLVSLDALGGVTGDVGQIYLERTGLTSLGGLERVPTIINLNLLDNPALADVSGLSSLQTVSTLQLENLPSLLQIPSMPSLTSFGVLLVRNNASLTDGGSFPSATTFGSIEYVDVPQMTSIDFPALTDASTVRIVDTGLTDLAGFEVLVNVFGDLEISDNAAMNTLRLQSTLDILGALTVTDNPLLSHCLAEELNTTATPSSFTESGNQGSGTGC